MERIKDLFVLPAINARIQRDLRDWKLFPDNEHRARSLGVCLNEPRGYILTVAIKKELLKVTDIDSGFITAGAASAYGREDGDVLVFSTSNKVRPRIAEIAKRRYLFLDHAGQRIGYCRPEYINSIKLVAKRPGN
ncbi:MAG TPA: hypothetical protein VJ227_00835 [Patescibacteria group bacterium]|nr:hypothetical protein [Patescibacteria group bacterium]